ncbi:MAG: hypothetical protein ACJ74C_14115 [Gaiellaceae bacterium]
MTGAELRRDTVLVTCAVSAGVHGALAPEHFGESTAAGIGFVASTAALAAVVVAITLRPASVLAPAGAATVLGGLLVAYALATTTGLPLFHPEPEPVDGLAIATKLIEALGLAAAVAVFAGRTRRTRPIPLFLTSMIALFSAMVALAVTTSHTGHTHGHETHHAHQDG